MCAINSEPSSPRITRSASIPCSIRRDLDFVQQLDDSAMTSSGAASIILGWNHRLAGDVSRRGRRAHQRIRLGTGVIAALSHPFNVPSAWCSSTT